MKIKKNIISLLVAGIFGVSGFAQNPITLYYMETIPQLTRINPAMQPRANGFLVLTSENIGIHSDLAFKNIIQNKGNNWYLPIESQFDFKDFYNRIGKAYDFTTNSEISAPILGFGFRIGNGYFTFSISEKVDLQFGMPKDFFSIADKGFPDGSRFDFSTLYTKAMTYTQISFGYSQKFTDELTIGLNVRPLLGQVAAVTNFKKFDMNTSKNKWSFDLDADVHTSFPVNFEYTNKDKQDKLNFPDTITTRMDKENWITKDYINYLSSFENPGIGFDIGAVYDFDMGLSISGALNNLGFISWKRDLNSMSVKGKYDFEGKIINDPGKNQFKNFFDSLEDSLKTCIEYPIGKEGFTTSLTPSVYLGASYQFTDVLSAGFLSRTEFYKNNVRQTFNLSGNMLLYRLLSLNLNLSQQINGSTYAGMGLALYLGPLEFYLLTDYLPLRYSKVKLTEGEGDKKNEVFAFDYLPVRFKDGAFMFGINILFGGKGFHDKPMYSRY